MYIWIIELNEIWTYHEKDEGDSNDFVIASKTAEAAIQKAKTIAMKKHFRDEDEGREHRVKSVELVGVKRGDWIDG